ncbi:flagellin [Rhodohalobacter mucosus]|nr:flagellin [Rhodohalobacter mucosus]
MTDTTFRRQVREARGEMVKFNEQIATGKRVRKGSDDSVAFTSGKLFEDLIRRNEQFQRNADNGLFQARTVQDSLSRMEDLLSTMKARAIEAGNDTKSADERESLANQFESMRDELLNISSTKYNGLHVFSGTASDAPPFERDAGAAGGVATLSTDRPLKVMVGDASVINTTITGVELRDTRAGDMFEIIQNTIDALRANDGPQIRDSIENLDETVNHVVGLSTRIANNINRLEYTNQRLGDNIIDQKGEVSRLVDADIIDSMLNFKNAQTSYDAILSSQSRMMQTSLLDYLR